jgi:hypothetical protein
MTIIRASAKGDFVADSEEQKVVVYIVRIWIWKSVMLWCIAY